VTAGPVPENPVARIRHNLVGLRMPRALEALEAVIQQIERGQLGAIEAIDTLLAEEITVREGRRIQAALQMARLATVKTLTGFNFWFQPSLDRNRIMALASLDFVDKHEVVHFIGQSGTGKSHLAVALGVEAIRAGRSVYFCPLADIIEPRSSPDIDSLAKADREGRLRERIRYLCRTQLLIIDEIGYVTLGAAAGHEQRRDLLEKAPPKRGDRVVIGMLVGGDEAERHGVKGGPFQLAAGEHPGGIASMIRPSMSCG